MKRLQWVGFALAMSLCTFSAVSFMSFIRSFFGSPVVKAEPSPEVMNNPLYVPTSK